MFFEDLVRGATDIRPPEPFVLLPFMINASIRFGISGKPADVPRDPKPVRPPIRKAERQGICSKAAGAYNGNDDAEISQNEGERVRDAVKDRISKFVEISCMFVNNENFSL